MSINSIVDINKSYVYRKHLRESFFSLFKGVLFLISIMVLMLIGLLSTDKNIIISEVLIFIAIFTAILFVVLTVELAVMYFALIRRFKKINVTLKEDCIIYNNAKKKIIIPYDDIEKIVFPSIKYTGGWVKIVYKGGNIRLTVVLENIGDFLYNLKAILDSKGKNDIYNEKKMFSFFKTASFSDESWQRLYDNEKFQILMYYVSCILTIIILFFSDRTQSNGIFIMGGVLIPVIGYLLAEIIIGAKVKKRIIENECKIKPRDVEWENKILRGFMIASTSIYILAVLIFKFVFHI